MGFSVSTVVLRQASSALGLICALSLGGCALDGAPSFTIAGAFFPAWMLCAAIGAAAALAARGFFLVTGLAGVLPLQLFLCTAVGVYAALGVFLVVFGR